MNDDDIEAYANNLEKKYQNNYDNLEEGAGQGSANVLPSVSDPQLWLVKCKQGSEREASICLMNKYLALKKQGQPLNIISATISDKVQGHLYVEAFKEVHVRDAIKGLRLIYQRDIVRIKKEETPSVFEIDKASKINLKKGQWVRVNTGLYAGDFAKVVGVDDSKAGCHLKIIPRLSIDTGEDMKTQDKKKSLLPVKPPQRFFNPNDVSGVDKKLSNIFNKKMYYWNKQYFSKGFLYKYFNFKILDTENIVPPRNVVDKFIRPEDDDDSQPSNDEDPDQEIEKWKKLAAENLSLTKGDKIRVISGDLKNLTGSVVSVDKSIVKMQPDHKDIPMMLNLDIKMIAKHFEAGDHIVVVEGENEGEKGIITKIVGNKLIVFSDVRKREFVTMSNNCKLSSQVAECVTTNIDHDYNVYDLVVTNKRTAGIVLSIEKDTLKIINQSGEVENIEVVDVSNKVIQKKNVSTLDYGGNFVSIGDTVKVVDGGNKGLKGIIRNIHQNTVFLHNKEFMETLGIFVEINRNILILGDDVNRGMGAPMNKRKDNLIGKIITIVRGEYKGFDAKVVDTSDKLVRVELFSKSKRISLKRADVMEKEKIKDEDTMIKTETKTPVPKTPAYYPNSPGWSYSTPAGQSPTGGRGDANVWRAKSPDDY